VSVTGALCLIINDNRVRQLPRLCRAANLRLPLHGLPRLSRILRRNRLVALLAALALIACSAVFSAHSIGDRAHAHTHCDLCTHFSGSAGSPAPAKIAGKPVLVVRVVPLPTSVPFVVPSPLGSHLPRGPPSSPAS